MRLRINFNENIDLEIERVEGDNYDGISHKTDRKKSIEALQIPNLINDKFHC